MPKKQIHLPDQDLLLALDGELPPRRADQVHAHISSCGACLARQKAIAATFADFNHVHYLNLDPPLPSADASRALLQAQLAEIAQGSRRLSWPQVLGAAFIRHQWACVCAAALLIVFVAGIVKHQTQIRQSETRVADLNAGAIPNRLLTPGIALPVTTADICDATQRNEEVQAIPTPLRQEVLQEYGLAATSANDYEIDYLITPGLGGAADVRNLWPESYSSTDWNAHVKDALEKRLHQLVCERKLSLAAAQHEIASDWITAYKKYFHTNKPIPGAST